MEHKMNLHYVKKTDLTDCELMICRDYFELPLDQFNNRLDHICHICHYYNIDINQLVTITQKVNVYDKNIVCQECNIARKVTAPSYQVERRLFNYICDHCHHFMHDNSIVGNLLSDDDCPF